MLLPFQKNRLYKVLKWVIDSSSDDGNMFGLEETDNLGVADIITSMVLHTDEYKNRTPTQMHTFVVDIDLPATLMPSSTPGHSHLYIESYMSWSQYVKVLDAMAEAGIIEYGYVNASKARGFTAVRLPWIRRNDRRPDASPDEGKLGDVDG